MYKVLLIDDDQITLELLQLILEEFVDGEITAFSDSSEAMQYVGSTAAGQLDLVICDWQMPKHDGLDVLRELRANHPDVPYLMLTGNATRDLVIAARKAGASDFIAKPFKNYDLTEKVKKFLN